MLRLGEACRMWQQSSASAEHVGPKAASRDPVYSNKGPAHLCTGPADIEARLQAERCGGLNMPLSSLAALTPQVDQAYSMTVRPLGGHAVVEFYKPCDLQETGSARVHGVRQFKGRMDAMPFNYSERGRQSCMFRYTSCREVVCNTSVDYQRAPCKLRFQMIRPRVLIP